MGRPGQAGGIHKGRAMGTNRNTNTTGSRKQHDQGESKRNSIGSASSGSTSPNAKSSARASLTLKNGTSRDDHFYIDDEELDEDELEVALDSVVSASLDEHYSFEDTDTDNGTAVAPKHAHTRTVRSSSQTSDEESNTADEILALLAMSLIELQAHIDFDEAR